MKRKNVFISALLGITLCLVLMAGATFALFLTESHVDAGLTTGKIELKAMVSAVEVYSPSWIGEDGSILDPTNGANTETNTFKNGGSATVDASGQTLALQGVSGGDQATFTLSVKNNSTIHIRYRVVLQCQTPNGIAEEESKFLFSKLNVTYAGATRSGIVYYASEWKDLAAQAEIADETVSVALPATADAACFGKTTALRYSVEAVQSNVLTTGTEEVRYYTVTEEPVTGSDVVLENSMGGGNVRVVVPADAVEASASSLQLTIEQVEETSATGVQVKADELATYYEVKVHGATEATAANPFQLGMFIGKQLQDVVLYHKGEAMTRNDTATSVEELAANEFFYDATSGYVYGKTLSFSPFDVVCLMPKAMVGSVAYYDKDSAQQAVDAARLANETSEQKTEILIYYYEATVNGKKYVSADAANEAADGSEVVENVAAYLVRLNGKGYFDLEKAMTDAKNDSVIQLVKDVKLSSPLLFFKVRSTVTLDLNGKTLSSDAARAVELKGGTLVVKNGNVLATNEAFKVLGTTARPTKLVLEESLNVVSETDCCIYIYGLGSEAETSANLHSKGVYAPIQGQGSKGNGVKAITVNGGNILADSGAAIYLPNSGVYTFNGGVISGDGALYVKCGTLNINGGKFISTKAERTEYTYNGNGCDLTGDAVIIDACDYPAQNPIVNITGGEFVVTASGCSGIAYYRRYCDQTATITNTTQQEITETKIHDYVNGVCSKCGEVQEGLEAVVGEGTSAKAYATLAEAVANAGGTVTIKLMQDVTLSECLSIADETKEITLDLNGKKIHATASKAIELNGGTLTLKNGSIEAEEAALRVIGDGADGQAVASKMVLASDLNVRSNSMYCVFVRGPGAELVTAANLTNDSVYATIQGNGQAKYAVKSITITGGKIENLKNAAMYLPNGGEVNISGGEIVGSSALYLKSGIVTITGGKFVATKTPAEDYQYNSNGANITGDAVVIDACGYPGGNPQVTIRGGEFIAASETAKGIAYYSYKGNEATIVNETQYEIVKCEVGA